MTGKTAALLLEQVALHSPRTAILDGSGEHTFAQLQSSAGKVASALLRGDSDLKEARVAYLMPPSFECLCVLLGIWSAGGIAVPLGLNYPPPEIQYMLEDCDAGIVIGGGGLGDKVEAIAAGRNTRFVRPEQLLSTGGEQILDLEPDRSALILYTSGTTSRPKGVVTTHRNISAQIRSLVEAWEWVAEDRILNVLPLHHVHGLINVVCSALWVGAACRMEPKFQVDRTFELLSRGEVTLFMAVPTIYNKLIHAWERSGVEARQRFSKGCSRMRLMVSGSAALPVQDGEKWKAITGHTLLERYGMTEIGMALSNPLHGPRKLGFVGMPLPGVEVKLADDSGEEVCRDDVSGEVYVRGDTVFREYWGQEQTTREAFDQGWFKTGDIALRREGYYRIEGRRSVDIIKSGGYKVSALEIEEVLRTHPRIRDCSVVGIPDEEWGERVAAAVLTPAQSIDLAELRAWASARLARQKVPSCLLVLEDFPRNALGKVVKPELKKLFLQRFAKGSPVE